MLEYIGNYNLWDDVIVYESRVKSFNIRLTKFVLSRDPGRNDVTELARKFKTS